MVRPREYGEETTRTTFVLAISRYQLLMKVAEEMGLSSSKLINILIEDLVSDEKIAEIKRKAEIFQSPSFEERIKQLYEKIEEEVIRVMKIRIQKNKGEPDFNSLAEVFSDDIYPLANKKYRKKDIERVIIPFLKQTWNNLTNNANFGRHSVEKKQKSPFPSEFSASSASSQNININEVKE